jgi:hypothetical protein
MAPPRASSPASGADTDIEATHLRKKAKTTPNFPDSPAKNTRRHNRSPPPVISEPCKQRKRKGSSTVTDLDIWDRPDEEIIGEFRADTMIHRSPWIDCSHLTLFFSLQRATCLIWFLSSLANRLVQQLEYGTSRERSAWR